MSSHKPSHIIQHLQATDLHLWDVTFIFTAFIHGTLLRRIFASFISMQKKMAACSVGTN